MFSREICISRQDLFAIFSDKQKRCRIQQRRLISVSVLGWPFGYLISTTYVENTHIFTFLTKVAHQSHSDKSFKENLIYSDGQRFSELCSSRTRQNLRPVFNESSKNFNLAFADFHSFSNGY